MAIITYGWQIHLYIQYSPSLGVLRRVLHNFTNYESTGIVAVATVAGTLSRGFPDKPSVLL